MVAICGEVVGSRYRLAELIGQGGMGRVWRSSDQLLQRDVAIKEVVVPQGVVAEERDRLLQRVMREARATARLNHPGIVTVHDVVEHQGTPMIVMELIPGRSLAAIIREDGPLPSDRVAAIGTAVAGALSAAHDAGIVHRDLKPDNILIVGDRVVITDFGIASIVDATALTSYGAVMGTPQYMSPEQIEGRQVTAASDLWSLGATLYTATEGEPPFGGPTLTAVFAAILTKDPRPARNAGPLASALVALLNKDPAQRATVHQVAGLLRPESTPERITTGPGGDEAERKGLLAERIANGEVVADNLTATLKTNHGDIVVRLFPSHAPKTVANFVELAEGRREWLHPGTGVRSRNPLYNNTIFHRVIRGFMIQGGDPLGNGSGGPGYKFADEIHRDLAFTKPFLLAMANAGPGTNGSQFFITMEPTPWLNGKQTIFGEVIGQVSRDVVTKIANVPTGHNDRPLDDVVIQSVKITRV